MERPSIKQTIEDMVRAILKDRPGFVPLGNVWMEWDGRRLTWDIPLKNWNVEAICQSLMQQADSHPDVEEIAICARALAYHSI